MEGARCGARLKECIVMEWLLVKLGLRGESGVVKSILSPTRFLFR